MHRLSDRWITSATSEKAVTHEDNESGLPEMASTALSLLSIGSDLYDQAAAAAEAAIVALRSGKDPSASDDGGSASSLMREFSNASEIGVSRLFARIDTDGNGFLDQSEVIAIFEDMKLELTKDEIQVVFSLMDVDSDYQITPAEFSRWIDGGSPHAKNLQARLIASASKAILPEDVPTKAIDEVRAEIETAEAQEASVRLTASVPSVLDAQVLLLSLGMSPDHLDSVFEQSSSDPDKAESLAACSAVVNVLVHDLVLRSGSTAMDASIAQIKANHVYSAMSGQTPLVLSNESPVLLISALSAKDKSGCSPLHYDAKQCHLPVVELLCMAGANMNQAGPESKSALALAAEGEHAYIVNFFISKGAKLEATDKRKRTPLVSRGLQYIGCTSLVGTDHSFVAFLVICL